MTAEDAMADALSRFPDCTYAKWTDGMAFPFTRTIVVELWRNEDCYQAGDPPRHVVEGYRR